MGEYKMDMKLNLLDENLELVDVIDKFSSLIWTDRFYEPGDFELYIPYTKHFVDVLKMGYYLTQKQSNKVMIIESIEFSSSLDEGTIIIVTGRSLESILDRRIIWNLTILDGNMQNQLEILLNDNVINPKISYRAIKNFIFRKVSNPIINSAHVTGKYYGDKLLDVVVNQCKEKKIGFSIELSDDNKFVFSLETGTDRSYDQNDVPYMVYSQKYNNLINSRYIISEKTYKNVALVVGEKYPESEERKTEVTGSITSSGLDRRELYSDANDISSSLDDGEVMPDSTYFQLLRQRGNKDLLDYKTTELFDGDMETTRSEYRKDFFMGDIVQISDTYIEVVNTKARIIEMIFSQDKNGFSAYPTFEIDEK